MSEFISTFLSILAVAAILISFNAFFAVYRNWSTMKTIIPQVMRMAKAIGGTLGKTDTATVITAGRVRCMVIPYTYGGLKYKAYLPLDRSISRHYAAVFGDREEDLTYYPSAKFSLRPEDIGANRIIARDVITGEIVQ